MKASEIRTLSAEELKARIGQWEEELFRVRFKQMNAETRDTSVFRKLRRDIARGKTILRERNAQGAPQDKAVTREQAGKE